MLQHLQRVDPDLFPASVEDLRAALDQQLHQLETRVEELRGVLRSNRRRSIKDYWRGKVPDLQLRWTAIRGAINVVTYAPSGLWSVRVRESEKVLLEASDVIGEVQRYCEALYAKRPVNLPAFERLVRAHIPRGGAGGMEVGTGLHPAGPERRREAGRGGRQSSGVQPGHGCPHSRAA